VIVRRNLLSQPASRIFTNKRVSQTNPPDVPLVGQPENDPETVGTPVVELTHLVAVVVVVSAAQKERGKCFQLFVPSAVKTLRYHSILVAIDQCTAQTATGPKELRNSL
jgi:hypothetical protein